MYKIICPDCQQDHKGKVFTRDMVPIQCSECGEGFMTSRPASSICTECSYELDVCAWCGVWVGEREELVERSED